MVDGKDAPHIVVTDDDDDVRAMIAEYLSANGFDVSTADGGAALRRIVAEREVDAVVLDLRMPGEDGLALTRFLRRETRAGVLMLTAAGETSERVHGLETGADDYMAKPAALRELLARLKAVLRRVEAAPDAPPREPAPDRPAPVRNVVRLGRATLDLDAHRLLDERGCDLALTTAEFALLSTFVGRPNRVLSRRQLRDLTPGSSREADDRSIDIRIARVRRKIEPDPARPTVIKTVRGFGYVFRPGPAVDDDIAA